MSIINCQAGICDPAPEHMTMVALSFAASGPPNCQATVIALRELVRRELAADIAEIDPDTSGTATNADTGELGVATGYDTTNLTITVGFTQSGLQALGVAAADMPADLIEINWGWFADTPTNAASGDLVVQICADSSYIVEHVLHRIEHELAGQLTVVWALSGEQRNGANHGGPLTADSARALIGFHDGLSNLDPNNPADQPLIFVGQAGAPPCPPTPPGGPQPPPGPGQPGYGQPQAPQPIFPTDLRPAPNPEPAWTTGGSYLMVRASLFGLGPWDAQTLAQQQTTVGRWKYSGAALDQPNDPAHRHDTPAFASNPSDVAMPPNSHIRRANPRALPTDTLRRIFRRGYPIIAPNPGGTLQRGLLFAAYARTLSTQAEFIMRAWLKNPNFPAPDSDIDPLLKIESTVIAGGYYFVPPVAQADQPWNWIIPGITTVTP
jgi:deferrochelatase/peroxidase EfeB